MKWLSGFALVLSLGVFSPQAHSQGQTLFSEDFESGDAGWTYTSGFIQLWHVANAAECGSVTQMLAYNRGPAFCNYQSGSVHNGNAFSPSFTLAGQPPFTCSIAYMRSVDPTGEATAAWLDNLTVGNSNEINLNPPITNNSTPTVTSGNLPASAHVGHLVKLRFSFNGNVVGNLGFGWLIDNVSVTNSNPNSSLPLCFGDGTGTQCPCSNNGGSGTGGGCANGAPMPAGQGAVLSASGSDSVAADDLILTADFVTNQPGLFFQGNSPIGGGSGTVFGDGLRCCGQGVVRLEIADPPGTNGPKTTSTTQAILGTTPPGTTTAGDTRCYQYWYRNPNRSLCGFNFNLSNAVTVTWQL